MIDLGNITKLKEKYLDLWERRDDGKDIGDDYGYALQSILDLVGGMRQGCFFCPNAPIKELAKLQRYYPNLWQELLDLNELYRKDKTQFVAQGFKYGMTFDEIVNQVSAINNQISIYDLIGE